MLDQKFDKLALLKSKKKELEKKIKSLETEIFNSEDFEWQKQVNTNKGKLVHNHKVTYKDPKNSDLIENGVLTEESVLKNAKITAGTLKKLIGTERFNELVEEGDLVQIKSESDYFTLK